MVRYRTVKLHIPIEETQPHTHITSIRFSDEEMAIIKSRLP